MALTFKKYPNLSAVIYTIFSIITVMYYYKNGGPRDFGLYANAGRAFLHGENAYLTLEWRSGSLGSAFIYLLSSIVPSAFLVGFFQLISFLGFWSLARVFQKESSHLVWIFGLALFLSPVREVINTLQITGLVSGLIALFLITKEFKNKVKDLAFQSLQIFALAIAVDLKPHSLLFVVLLLFLKKWKRTSIFIAGGVLILGHLLIDIVNNRFLERDWFDSLSNLGNASGSTGESTSLWKLIDYLSKSKIDTSLLSISLVFCLTALSIFFIKKCSIYELVIIGLLISTLMTYMHYYDLASLAVIVLVVFMNKKLDLLGTTLIMFLFLPREITNLNNLVILIGLIILISAVKLDSAMEKERIKSAYLNMLGSFLIFLALHGFNSIMGLNYRMTHTLMTTETMILIWAYLLINMKVWTKIDFEAINSIRRVQK